MDIAIKCKSARDNFGFFKIPGLGDRIHIFTCAWALYLRFNDPVTIHLSAEKYSERKNNSLAEIKELFPIGSVDFKFHNVYPKSEKEWKVFIRQVIPDIKFFYYSDHRGAFESKEKIDISPFLKNFHKLNVAEEFIPSLNYPTKFITTQWDSTASTRSLQYIKREKILEKYKNQGYSILYVGGEAIESSLRESLSEIAFAISKSDFFVGVDSAFSHLAHLYLPISRVHLYNEKSNYWSHHLLRYIDNGGPINKYYVRVSSKERLMIKLKHDSPLLKKLVIYVPGLKSILKLLMGN